MALQHYRGENERTQMFYNRCTVNFRFGLRCSEWCQVDTAGLLCNIQLNLASKAEISFESVLEDEDAVHIVHVRFMSPKNLQHSIHQYAYRNNGHPLFCAVQRVLHWETCTAQIRPRDQSKRFLDYVKLILHSFYF